MPELDGLPKSKQIYRIVSRYPGTDVALDKRLSASTTVDVGRDDGSYVATFKTRFYAESFVEWMNEKAKDREDLHTCLN